MSKLHPFLLFLCSPLPFAVPSAAEFLEYEAPTFPGFHPAVPSAGGSSGAAGLGAVGAQSMDGDAGEGAAGDGGPTVLRVALTAGGGDPLAMYAKALASVR